MSAIIIMGLLGGGLYAFGQRILEILPIITNALFGFRIFHITQLDKISILSHKVKKNASELRDMENAGGIFMGFGYFGWFEHKSSHWAGSDSMTAKIFCRQKTYDKLLRSKGERKIEEGMPDPTQHLKLKVIENTAVGFYPEYATRDIVISKRATPTQQICIETIVQMFHQREEKHLTCFISGEVGSGKSMSCLLLAQHLGAKYSDDLRPLKPGSFLRQIYAAASPSIHNPLVLVIEEVDIVLQKIHELNSDVSAHKRFAASVSDKTSWNAMLDSIDNGKYPNLILVMTSNKSIGEISELDPAYLRPGRVHFEYVMQKHEFLNPSTLNFPPISSSTLPTFVRRESPIGINIEQQ